MARSGAERIIDFSGGQAHLAMRLGQLVIEREGMPTVTTPLEEIAVLVLGSRRLTCTQPVMGAVMESGGSIVVCNEAMLPTGMMLPLSGHCTQTQRMIAQAKCSLPLRKRVWQQIVQAKLRSQASALRVRQQEDPRLDAMAKRVGSGDPDNLEAQGAQRYWTRIFGDPAFRRRHEADDQNRLLNYGYAVMRAGVARAICAVGLHPSLGVHHRSRNNAFCLADDLLEPWRPLIDLEVAEITGESGSDAPLDRTSKQRLVGVLHERLSHDGEARTVLEWIGRSASSLAAALTGNGGARDVKLFFPDGLFEP